MRTNLFFAVIFMIATFQKANATTFFVDIDATGANDGSSWTDAYTELQLAINASATDDEIWVAAGTYHPTRDANNSPTPADPRTKYFTIKYKGIQIYGGFNGTETTKEERDHKANITILSGDTGVIGDDTDNNYRVMYMLETGTKFLLDGVTITKGRGTSGSSGGGVYNDVNATFAVSSPTFRNCIFIDNFAGQSGGGYVSVSDLQGRNVTTFYNCKFLGNTANYAGGAIASLTGWGGFDASMFLYNCVISGNTCPDAALYIEGRSWNLPNVSNNSKAHLINTVVAFNSGKGIHSSSGGAKSPTQAVLNNSIVWGHPSNEIQGGISGNNNITNTGGTIPGTNNHTTNPLFSQVGTGYDGAGPDNTYGTLDDDYSLVPQYQFDFSEAINGGMDSIVIPEAYSDLACNARFFGSAVDIGAYEYGAPSADRAIVYVRQVSTSGANDGTSWGNAYTDLSTALANVHRGYEVWVAQGTYHPSVPIDMDGDGVEPREATFFIDKSDVKILGGFRGTEFSSETRQINIFETILDGDIGMVGDSSDNSFHVVTFWDNVENTVFDGFTIQNGRTEDFINHTYPLNTLGGGILLNGKDGGICNPTIRNCKIINNTGEIAPGLGAHSSYFGETSPVIENCYFGMNEAGSSFPAMYFYGQHDGTMETLIVNNIFNGNTVLGGGSHRMIGFYAEGHGSMNFNFHHNTTVNTGPNSADRTVGIYAALMANGKKVWRFSNNIFYGGYIGINQGSTTTGILTNNINPNFSGPLFADLDGADDIQGNLDDNLNLICSSTAVGYGDAAIGSQYPLDYNGNERLANGTYDPGALEYGTTCDPRTSSIPAAPGTYTSSYSMIDAAGNQSFCDCNGNLLLSLNVGTSGAVVPDNGVQIKVNSTTATYHAPGTSFITNPTGGVVLDRYWEVTPTTQPSNGNVEVFHYFTDKEYEDVNQLLTTYGFTPLTSPTELSFYKVVTPGLVFPDPATLTPADVIVIDNIIAPRPLLTTEWTYQSYDYFNNPTVNAARMLVNSFSGGGGGGSSNGESLAEDGTKIKAFLEGPFNVNSSSMFDDLRVNQEIPTMEPFTALGYIHTGGGGGETVSPAVLENQSGRNAIIDWVLVELRAQGSTTVVESQSALLQADGEVVSVNGVSPVFFAGKTGGNYHITIAHRNHLSVTSLNGVTLNDDQLIDFTNPSTPVFGNNARATQGSKSVLHMGDATFDGAVDAADRSETWNVRNQTGYLGSDLNLDGATDAADRSAAWNKRNTVQQIP